jgi:hypothetical protein
MVAAKGQVGSTGRGIGRGWPIEMAFQLDRRDIFWYSMAYQDEYN